MVERIDEFNSRDLSNAAWAFLTLGNLERQTMLAIAKRSASILATFNAQECSKLCTRWIKPTYIRPLWRRPLHSHDSMSSRSCVLKERARRYA